MTPAAFFVSAVAARSPAHLRQGAERGWRGSIFGGNAMRTRVSGSFAAAVALMFGALGCGETQAQMQLPTVKQRRITQPAPVIRSAPGIPSFPVAIPETDPNTPLGLAMAQNCSTGYPQPNELVL